jgi:hypothetical protein
LVTSNACSTCKAVELLSVDVQLTGDISLDERNAASTTGMDVISIPVVNAVESFEVWSAAFCPKSAF